MINFTTRTIATGANEFEVGRTHDLDWPVEKKNKFFAPVISSSHSLMTIQTSRYKKR
jgi:hypothetical protein